MKKLNITIIAFLISIICFSQNFKIVYEHNALKGKVINELELYLNDSLCQFNGNFEEKIIKIDYYEITQSKKHFLNNYNFKTNTFTENAILKSKVYYSEWKNVNNWEYTSEMDTILGYSVRKAVLKSDSEEGNVYAWFTTDIPYPGGPLRYCGLPGLVLKVNFQKSTTTIIAKTITESVSSEMLKLDQNAYKISKDKIISYDFN